MLTIKSSSYLVSLFRKHPISSTSSTAVLRTQRPWAHKHRSARSRFLTYEHGGPRPTRWRVSFLSICILQNLILRRSKIEKTDEGTSSLSAARLSKVEVGLASEAVVLTLLRARLQPPCSATVACLCADVCRESIIYLPLARQVWTQLQQTFGIITIYWAKEFKRVTIRNFSGVINYK